MRPWWECGACTTGRPWPANNTGPRGRRQIRAGDDPDLLGLQSGVVPGGQFLSATLRGPQPAAYALLTPTFQQLGGSGDRDDTRPSIEYYRRNDRIDLLMPLRGTT